jgi:hypothetical protein
MADGMTYKEAHRQAVEQTPVHVANGKTLSEIASMYADWVYDDCFTNASDALLGTLQTLYPEHE